MPDSPYHARKASIRDELAATRTAFHALLASLSDDDWRRPSHNPGWTNAEVLFHMAFAFFLLPSLLRLASLFGRLPKRVTRPLAVLMNLGTGPFNRINALGPRIGGRVFTRASLGRMFDRVYARIVRRLEAVPEPRLQRGMHYPTKWDALFADYMTLEQLFLYPTRHFRFHRNQIKH